MARQIPDPLRDDPQENVIDAALRIGDEKRTGYNITIEALVILAESDMTQKARQKMIAEWRRMRLL